MVKIYLKLLLAPVDQVDLQAPLLLEVLGVLGVPLVLVAPVVLDFLVVLELY